VFNAQCIFKEMFTLIQILLCFHIRTMQLRRQHLHTVHTQFFIMTD